MTKANKLINKLSSLDLLKRKGRVEQVIGLLIKSRGPAVPIGSLCHIKTNDSLVLAEAVGFDNNLTLFMPLGDVKNIHQGCEVEFVAENLTVKVSEQLLGKVINGLGEPINIKNEQYKGTEVEVNNNPLNPLDRPRINQVLPVGIKAIDGLMTIGKGQRLGIFAGSGVGKSTVLGMMARNAQADINVIALIGERGREVNDFLQRDLGTEGLKKSVIIVATSDQPPLVRLKGALVATAVAEHFRDCGKDVLLMMDSLTRFSMAQREIGLATGEPPATRGYTPSVFSLLPKLLERTGTSNKGSITGFYTVLVEGDDFNEPITDAVRGILDGHIILSRDLAAQNHYPAIDILNSVSRVMVDITNSEHQQRASKFKNILATYYGAKDLIDIGAYKKGSNPKIDYAIRNIDQCNRFLQQHTEEVVSFEETLSELAALIKK